MTPPATIDDGPLSLSRVSVAHAGDNNSIKCGIILRERL